MIDSTLEFPSQTLRTVVATFLALPEGLRPTHHSVGEDDVDEPIRDRARQLETFAKRTSGFFLKGGPRVTYDVSLAGTKPIICNCFLEVEPSLAEQFLMHMAAAKPTFGFACSREERYQRNRVTIKQGVNTIESWVGRDTQKYVPGFYWLTLLPGALAEQHDVPLSAVAKVAKEHVVLEHGQHLFRFYERPGDWRGTSAVVDLCASLPGLFDVEKVKPHLQSAKNFLELDAILRTYA